MSLLFLGTVFIAGGGCTTFSNTRSAEVLPGMQLGLQGAITSPVGDVTGWFFTLFCTENCNYPVAGTDVGFTHGWTPGLAGRPMEVGLGFGLLPYTDLYVQLGTVARPFGVGARIGIPVDRHYQYQLYGRYDVLVRDGKRLLLNPALFVHRSNHEIAGSGGTMQSGGSFTAFVQSVGVLYEREEVSFTPSFAVVVGRGERNSYGQQFGPETSVFGVLSFGMIWHRRRSSMR